MGFQQAWARGASVVLLTLTLGACGGGSSGGGGSSDDTGGGSGSGGSGGSGGGGSTESYTVGGTISSNSGDVVLSLNGTEETFSASPFTFTATLEDGTDYSVAFVSADGDLACAVENAGGTITANVTDIVVTCSQPIQILSYEDVSIYSGSMKVGDFNGDMRPDIAMTVRSNENYPSGADQWLLRYTFGDGAGQFDTPVDVATVDQAASSLQRGAQGVVSDYTGDTIDDVALLVRDNLQLFAGDASDNPSSAYVSGVHPGEVLRQGDINEDGHMDVLTVYYGGSRTALFALYAGDGSGNFSAAQGIANIFDAEAKALSMGRPLNFQIADFNGDTHLDILSIGETGTVNVYSMVLLTGDGAGNFAYPASAYTFPAAMYAGSGEGSQSKELTAGDFDGDGDLDIAITSNTTFLQVMLNDGLGNFSEGQQVTVGTMPIHVVTADFDLDGNLDLFSLNATSRTGILNFGNGDGTFRDSGGADETWRQIDYPSYVELEDLEIADLDQDGYLDVIVSSISEVAITKHDGSVHISYGVGK